METCKGTLIVSVVDYFGRTTIKPECELSRLFAELLRQRTLTPDDVERIKRLGYEIRTKEVKL